jgi:hypothetical protein
MDRELVLAVLCAWLIGPLLALGALLLKPRAPQAETAHLSGPALEADAAWELLAPLVPAGLAFAGLVGWAFREPADAEMLPWPLVALALVPWLGWTRAFARALHSLLRPAAGPALTVGLFRPRVVVSPAFSALLDDTSRSAMLAHERAHARHFDPLRLWLAQLATDVQWPLPGARARLDAYREALELARDDEARLEVDGADLASAVLHAARLGHRQEYAVAGIGSRDHALKHRVERLLSPVPAASRRTPWRARAFMLAATIAVCLGLGWRLGEVVISRVFGAPF